MTSIFTPRHLMEALRSEIHSGWSEDPRTLHINPGVSFSDGEPIEIFARISENGDHVILSDAGTVTSRASSLGVEVTSGAAGKLITSICQNFSVQLYADRFYIRVDSDLVSDYVPHFAGALAALDSARFAYTASQTKFSDSLESWLSSTISTDFELNKKVESRFGDTITVTAAVPSARGEILIQAAGGRNAGSLKTTSEHAYFNLSSLSADMHPIENRLIVLESTLYEKKLRSKKKVISIAMTRLTKRLTEVAYVAAFDTASRMSGFIIDGDLGGRDLVSFPSNQTAVSYSETTGDLR